MTLQNFSYFLLIAGAASALPGQTQPVELQPQISLPFRFVAYGDTRFTDPKNTDASNPSVARRWCKPLRTLILRSSPSAATLPITATM